jgi:mycobactin lysine-N-oxygenase
VAFRKLAIIGGGAKAAAVCAKAACLRDTADIDLRVTVFECAALGAHWSGGHGYTDGEQLLCTPAERDSGFPYSSEAFGPEVAEAMQARFSWMAFAIQRQHYGTWVDQGRPAPNHRQFSEYIDFCITGSGAEVVSGEVTAIARAKNRWNVTYRNSGGVTVPSNGFHGVVVTGPGPAKSKLVRVSDSRIFDGVNFWRKPSAIQALANAAPNVPIAIVGSGGTAAAIAGWLVRAQVTNQVVILGRQPALYARADSFFENRTFSSPAIWESLSDSDRIAFTERLTRGAVWSNVLHELSRASNLNYLPGTTKIIRHEPESDPNGALLVEFTTSRDATVRSQIACVVVDATGFDPVWFSSLFEDGLRAQLEIEEDVLRVGLDSNLRLDLTVGRSVHAPMLSQVVSPAYTSLMALGSMADAVLEPYVTQLA